MTQALKYPNKFKKLKELIQENILPYANQWDSNEKIPREVKGIIEITRNDMIKRFLTSIFLSIFTIKDTFFNKRFI